jgi:hypothetical protein
MKLFRRLFLAAPLLAATVSAHAQKRLEIPTSWYGVRIEDNAFTVEMPGIPDHRVVNDRSSGGTAFQLHSYSLETGGNSYVAQTALYPFDVDVTQPRLILQASLNGRAQQLAGRQWTKTEWSELEGAAAVTATGTLTGGNVLRQLNILKERRFVSLAFLGSPAAATGADAARFFKSVKLA